MANSIYTEVTSVSASGFERDRVLDKLTNADKDLPYSLGDITISHNDYAVADVINDSIKKLYNNYLYLIANAEIVSKNAPTSAADFYLAYDTSNVGRLSSISDTPSGNTHTKSLTALKETFIVNKTDVSDKMLIFNYSKDQSYVSELNTHINPLDVNDPAVLTLLTGNEVEFNKTFKFKEVVSVDTSGNLLFVLDKGANTCYKFDISGLITEDPALKRTSDTDTKHPGRYLLKTIGGEGTSRTKNKLNNPNSLSVFDNRIYILDNGNFTLKVFDLNFNFIQECHVPSYFNNPNYGNLVSITVDQYSDNNKIGRGYILTDKGKIFEYDIQSNKLTPPIDLYSFYDTRLQVLSGVSLEAGFLKIVNSKVRKNVLYVCNKGRIYKYYKTNLNTYLDQLDLESLIPGLEIGSEEEKQEILSFDTVKHNNKEYIAITTITRPDGEVSTYFCIDDHVVTKLYSENFYTNYFTLSSIVVLPQEIVNNITFNKTIKKLIYNHYSFFENLNKKIYSFYKVRNTTSLYATLCGVRPHQFDRPTELLEDNNMYIGVNEPLLTDVINRPLTLLYNQQKALFNLIQESRLNTNPPEDYTIHLPGNTESFPNVISLGNVSNVNSGDTVTFTITRTNILTEKPSCSFAYWTTVGTNTTENDITYISSSNKSIAVFDRNVNTVEITINTKRFFSGPNKSFTFHIEGFSNCIVDSESDSEKTVSFAGVGDMYSIAVSATTGTVLEGSKIRVGVVRTRIDGNGSIPDENVESSINARLVASNPRISYTPTIAGGTEYTYVGNQYSDFSATAVYQQSFAHVIGSTSTITFTNTITSVVFDIDVNNNFIDDPGSNLAFEIYNPSDGSILGSDRFQNITVNDEFKSVTLFLSSISATNRADDTSTTLLSNINIWEALSADTTFQEYSATNNFNVEFTVNEPLSVFSVNTLSGALYFDPIGYTSLNFHLNTITINVEENAAIVGKGGNGGHGFLWVSGSDATADGTGNDDLRKHTGESDKMDGGDAIGNVKMGDDFFSITLNNSGHVYGGSGGGAGGTLGVSASNMPNVAALSGGCGGGGGMGIHEKNWGLAGLAAAEGSGDPRTFATDPDASDIYLQPGNEGSLTSGGLGGGFNTGAAGYPTISYAGETIAVTEYMLLTGLSGGSFGMDGQQGDVDYTTMFSFTPDTSFDTVSSGYTRRSGSAGFAVGPYFQNVTIQGSGTHLGAENN